jgi:N-acyl-D-amino-acid deacylase
VLAALLLGCALLAQQPHVEGGVPSTGRADPRLTSFDALMRDFVRERGAPGATLAVSRDGRLVYARGFGFADPASGEVMPPEARMRIASLSKPITAAMVLLLAQEGALELDDPALALLDPRLYRGRVPADGRWGEVTVAHLLEHTAGLDRRRSGDAPWRSVGCSPPARWGAPWSRTSPGSASRFRGTAGCSSGWPSSPSPAVSRWPGARGTRCRSRGAAELEGGEPRRSGAAG